MITRFVATPFVYTPCHHHKLSVLCGRKANKESNGKDKDSKVPRITSNVKKNLQALKQLREFESQRSRIPKSTTRYRKKKEKQEEPPSDDDDEDAKTLRISSNKQNLQVLQQLRVFERKRSRIPKPTTRYRWKKEKREEAPSYDEVYEHPPKLYDTKEDFSVGAPVLLVDGYNVCGYWPKLKKHFSEGRLRIARQKLADELICFSELRGIKVVVVYDAMRSGLPTHKETYGNIDIVYSANSSADTWIEKEVTALRADGCPRVCVATSDSLQQHSAHHLGAFVWSCKTLISEINDTKSDYKELQFEQRSYSMQDGMLENNLKPEVVDALKELKKKLEEYERSQTRSKRLQETGVQA